MNHSDVAEFGLGEEREDLPEISDLLDESWSGFTPLHHALELEADGHVQTGE